MVKRSREGDISMDNLEKLLTITHIMEEWEYKCMSANDKDLKKLDYETLLKIKRALSK